MLTINVQSNIKEFSRTIDNFAWKQLPFASAQALNAIGAAAIEAEQANEVKVLDRPRPFTTNAIRLRKASKASQEATVWMQDITAAYLEPYQFGGLNVLNAKSQAVLKPVGAKPDEDEFGNLPRFWSQKYKGRTDIFIGAIRTKAGIVNGIWQRATTDERKTVTQTRVVKSGKNSGKVIVRKVARWKGPEDLRGLRLLVKFVDPHPVLQNLDWFGVAQKTVGAVFKREMGRALARAIATARK